MWLLIAVIFLVSLIIGFGVIFALKNVNVTLESYSFCEWEEMPQAQKAKAEAAVNEYKQVLGKFRGTMMPFLADEEIAACFDGADYEYVGCEKVLPCTLNVTIRERREVFVVADGAEYNAYDMEGDFLHRNSNYLNRIDGAPNILLPEGTTEQQIKQIAAVSEVFAEKFSALRTVVSSISLQTTDTVNVEFNLRCGIVVRLVDYQVKTEEKMQAAYEVFSSLTGEEKLSGTIRANVLGDSGTVSAVRTPDR